MKGIQRRVGLTKEEFEVIDKIAEQYDCIYGGEPNLSMLLRKVIQGELALDVPNSHEPILKSDLIVRFRIPINLRGVCATIVKVFADNRVNVIQSRCKDRQDRFEKLRNTNHIHPGYFYFLLNYKDAVKLKSALRTISKFTIDDLNKTYGNEEYLEDELREKCDPSHGKKKTYPLVYEIMVQTALEVDINTQLYSDVDLLDYIAKNGILLRSHEVRINQNANSALVTMSIMVRLLNENSISDEVNKEEKYKDFEDYFDNLLHFVGSGKDRRPEGIRNIKTLKSLSL